MALQKKDRKMTICRDRFAKCVGVSLIVLTCLAASLPARAELVVAYPVPYVLYQRTTPEAGPMRIRGAYRAAGTVGTIEARFQGGPWQPVDPKPLNGAFSGTITAPVGQGRLELRASGDPTLVAVVEPVSVGDLFLITGQSNADGRGDKHLVLDAANPFLGVKYRQNAWSRGDDPSANDGNHGSPWPIVLNDLIPEQKVPIGYIAAAVGSTVVQEWRKGGRLYDRMFKIVTAATDGSMRIKAVLYYQGENDITEYHSLSVKGDYTKYKANLTAAIQDFRKDFAAMVLVGQITNLGGDRARNDAIRKVQQELWGETPGAVQGAIAYDIRPSDGVHYRTEVNLRAFAQRWAQAIRASVYGNASAANPKLERLTAADAQRLRLRFDQPLAIARWDGVAGPKALGFRIVDAGQTLTDTNVQETVVQGREVLVKLDRPVSSQAVLSYGSGPDGQGQPTLKGAANHLPVRMIFAKPVDAAPIAAPSR